MNNFLSKKKACWLFLGICLIINMFSVDIYLPAMPAMETELEASPFILKLIFIINFIEFSISPLALGIVADIKGRKPAIFICLGLAIAGQLLSAISVGPWTLMLSRIIQYLGAGGLSAIILTLICDNFEGYSRAKAIALFEMSLPLAVALGPLLGVTLLTHLGWRGAFLLFLTIQIICFVVVFYTLPEMHLTNERVNFKETFKGMIHILKDPISSRIIMILGLTEGGWMIFTISSSFFYLRSFNLTLFQYAFYQTIPVVFFFLGLGAYRFLADKIKPLKLFNLGMSGYVFFGLNLFLFTKNIISLSPLNLCFFITGMNFCCGLISPNANALVLSRSNQNVFGTSTATYTSVINLIVGIAMLCGDYLIDAKLSFAFLNCLLVIVIVAGVLSMTLTKFKQIEISPYSS
jgi:DHA1 family bicyclomycin/chloramphenicol resistance-like MFS transporter